MSILWALIVGLVIGAVAKLIMPGKDAGGVIVTMALGIAGSVLAYLAGRALGFYSSYQSGPGMLASILGAMAILAIYRYSRRQRAL